MEYRISLELFNNGEEIFLNYWGLNGNDVACKIEGDNLITDCGDGDRITLSEFISRVEAVIQKEDAS